MAIQTGTALAITRELLGQKLEGQAQVARKKLLDTATADTITRFRAEVTRAETIEAIRNLESKGAAAYWAAWRDLPINFPLTDLPKVPDHWRRFDTRKSPLSGSPRLAANPPNAILNYLYAVLESETRLAVTALGLDPGLGFWHVDTPARDSLACDLMEPVRPQVDAFLLDWIMREPLKRAWFFEQRDGNCRLMSSLAVELAQTARTWARAVGPFAEWVARTLWSDLKRPNYEAAPATRLTQSNRSKARGIQPKVQPNPFPKLARICRGCGTPLKSGKELCATCSIPISRSNLINAAKLGRIATHTPRAETLRAETQRRQMVARKAWSASNQPDWLTAEFYTEAIQLKLSRLSAAAIARAISVSMPYATDIRRGRRRPHPRHWQTLAQLLGVSQPQ
jgi:hypothetical protein